MSEARKKADIGKRRMVVSQQNFHDPIKVPAADGKNT